MRLTRVLCFLIIFGSSAIAAYGQTPVDPLVKLEGVGEPTCADDPTYICYTDTTNPLMETYGEPNNFIWAGAGDLNSLTLEIIDAPAGVIWECQTNIWTDCADQEVSGNWFFYFTDDTDTFPAPCNAGAGSCSGFLTPDELVDYTQTPLLVDTPEPGTIILFGTGLILFFVGSKRRVYART